LIAVVVLVLGVVNVGVGAAFIGIGADKYYYLKSTMEEEQITLGVATEGQTLAEDEVVDTMTEAQSAGDIVRGHRHDIAPTYGDLLGGERFDPSKPEQLTYAQAMNIENYLYLAVASFGITYLSMGIGGALLLAGIALIAVAVVLYKWAKRVYGEAAEAAAVGVPPES
jgi:hypothetical protein